jgi:hypothetical protein
MNTYAVGIDGQAVLAFVAMGKLTWMRATIPDEWNINGHSSKEKVLA